MVLVYLSVMLAQIVQQVTQLNLVVIAGVLVSIVASWIYFNWFACVRFYFTFFRDIRAGIALLRAKYFMYQAGTDSNVPVLFHRLTEKHPNKVAFYYKDEEWTFKQMDEWSNRVANAFEALGYKRGDEVALVMNSRPEFVGVWLGMAKNGIVTAFINTNQRMETLVHSITAVKSRAVIFDVTLAKSIQEAMPLIQERIPNIEYFSFTGRDHEANITTYQPYLEKIPSRRLEDIIASASSSQPTNMFKQNMNDKLYYIFTSGTTGLPKAAVIRHHRYVWIGMILHYLFSIGDDDVLYLTLPLYHNNAGTIGTCQCVIFGTSTVLKEKFSASQFWDDCIKYKATVAMYIGELCRYLLAQPRKPNDTQHRVRLMFGNGLRQEIWGDFKNRFNIKQVGEVYGSTEGNANVANYDFKEGACGIIPCCVPLICKLVFPVTVIKVDPATGEYVRDRNGLCKLVKGGEIGEIVGKICNDAGQSYPGYVNSEATKKKIIQNVFRHGDSAFLSGDLVEMDDYGYLYFRDRTGDTFRWKGENVSTNEVEAVIQKVVKLSDCVVFGVSITHCDGKAGMAVVADPNRTVELTKLYLELNQRLPAFAIPIFIRMTAAIELTGSFKLSKTSLERDGFNPSKIADPIFFLDRKTQSYIQLTAKLYDEIQSGQLLI